MDSVDDHIIPVQKVVQNNQEFFIGIFTIKQVLRFTRYTERLIVGYDEDNLPVYNPEIQRSVENSRVDKIADFLIDDPDAVFPTNIVVSIPNMVIDTIDFDGSFYNIKLNDVVFDEIAKKGGDVHLTIIDGQHRIKGIEKAIERLESQIKAAKDTISLVQSDTISAKYERNTKTLANLLKIQIMVSFFIDKSLEFQAMIFSTINRTQRSVSQSLVYSLFGLTSNDSPQKTALETVLALNAYEKSPFYQRIKLYGGSYEINQSPPLTQAGMVKSIVDYISVNIRESERDRFRNRKELLNNITFDVPFRLFYARNEDFKITDTLYSFFSAVRDGFISENGRIYWEFVDNTRPSNVLQTTVGYQALLLILRDILYENKNKEVDKIDFKSYINKAVGLNFEDIGRYPFTSKTRKILYLDLSLKIWPPDPKVEPDLRTSELKKLLEK